MQIFITDGGLSPYEAAVSPGSPVWVLRDLEMLHVFSRLECQCSFEEKEAELQAAISCDRERLLINNGACHWTEM